MKQGDGLRGKGSTLSLLREREYYLFPPCVTAIHLSLASLLFGFFGLRRLSVAFSCPAQPTRPTALSPTAGRDRRGVR
jgi:hypothetical protein